MLRIDYTQYKAFKKCPWYWYEKFVRGMVREWQGQREDILAVGSLVHAGVEEFRKTGKPGIPQKVVEEIGPTNEALAEAGMLVYGWIQEMAGSAKWESQWLEEPLMFMEGCGLAKIDRFFEIKEIIRVPAGFGEELVLEPGWWIEEYKTKGKTRDRHLYNDAWEVNMQADFQMLALAEKIGEYPKGVLVNVIEKPDEYVPVRTCKGCKVKSEYRSWVPTGEKKEFKCPWCGNVQGLTDPDVKPRVANYWRLMALRTPKRLEVSEDAIWETYSDMRTLMTLSEFDKNVEKDLFTLTRRANWENCVDLFGKCDYFNVHKELTKAGFGFVKEDTLRYQGVKDDISV